MSKGQKEGGFIFVVLRLGCSRFYEIAVSPVVCSLELEHAHSGTPSILVLSSASKPCCVFARTGEVPLSPCLETG